MSVDWRIVRDVIKIVKPDWKPQIGDEPTPDSDAYEFCRQVIEAYIEHSKVTCCECLKKQHPALIYRCWDCKGYMCEECVQIHFGPKHVPHPLLKRQYEEKIKALETELAGAYKALQLI